jgi:hypothetical protein
VLDELDEVVLNFGELDELFNKCSNSSQGVLLRELKPKLSFK